MLIKIQNVPSQKTVYLKMKILFCCYCINPPKYYQHN